MDASKKALLGLVLDYVLPALGKAFGFSHDQLAKEVEEWLKRQPPQKSGELTAKMAEPNGPTEAQKLNEEGY